MTFYLAVSLIGLFSLSSFAAQHEGFKIPLIRATHSLNTIHAISSENEIPVVSRNDYSYIVSACIGAQSFPFILDTGSSDLWVISSSCENADCANVPRYSRAFSTNFSLSQTPFQINYIMGSVTGLVASETVSLGPYQLNSQVFGLANSTQGIKFSNQGYSGILGLSFPSEASMPGMTVLQSIFSGLSDPYFTISLGSRLGSSANVNSTDPSPSLTLGQIDTTSHPDINDIYTDFFMIPVSSAGANDYTYWKVPLLYLTINSTDSTTSKVLLSPSSVHGAQRGSQIAVLDTGTTLILGPTQDVQTFWMGVGSSATRKDPVSGMWQIRCEKAVIVGLVLGREESHMEFLLDPADISWAEGGSNDGWCTGGIQANNEVDTGDWLLGDGFLRNVYSLYHAANSSSGPWIGLISTTNATSALAAFRQTRGPDLNSSSSSSAVLNTHTIPRTRYRLLYTVSTVCGFVGGMVLTTLFRARRGLSTAIGGQKRKQ